MDGLRKEKVEPVTYKTGQSLEGDIINTWDNLDVAEKIKNHEWKFNQEVYDNKDRDEPVDYNWDSKLDDDIVSTQGHIGAAEKRLGDWDIFKTKANKFFELADQT